MRLALKFHLQLSYEVLIWIHSLFRKYFANLTTLNNPESGSLKLKHKLCYITLWMPCVDVEANEHKYFLSALDIYKAIIVWIKICENMEKNMKNLFIKYFEKIYERFAATGTCLTCLENNYRYQSFFMRKSLTWTRQSFRNLK